MALVQNSVGEAASGVGFAGAYPAEEEETSAVYLYLLLVVGVAFDFV